MIRAYTYFALLLVLSACTSVPTPEQQIREFQNHTGLQPFTPNDTTSGYLQKTHRGYPVLFHAEMGEVWGRYAARMAIGEVGRNVGPIGEFLSGSHEHVGTVVGGPLDRLLSRAIGQPLTFFVTLKHQKKSAPRLDIISDFSTIAPTDTLPKISSINLRAGSIYAEDPEFAKRIQLDSTLYNRLSNLRSQYIRIDDQAVTFIFSSSETEWSSTIREHGGYYQMINSVLDILADIADKIPN